jgi:hypothetical protein
MERKWVDQGNFPESPKREKGKVCLEVEKVNGQSEEQIERKC